MRVVVLGGGRVGAVIARDLAVAGEFDVTVVDRDVATLTRLASLPRVETVEADVGDAATVTRAVQASDLAVGAVPGAIGFATLRAALAAGRPVVDISFFPEDPFDLDDLARRRGVTAVVDAGVAPGVSNLLAGQFAGRLEAMTRFACYVPGVPARPEPPWHYKAPFSPIDVIAEYVRPARLVRGGAVVAVRALSEPELLEFAGVGTLEAFATDGLRTLLRTVRCPEMVEKTMRWPGHRARVEALRDAGFFGEAPLRVGSTTVRPVDVAAALLFPAWHLEDGEEDLTVMRVIVEGRSGGRPVRHTFDLLDRYDATSGTTSMARTTGYTCTATVRLLAAGGYRKPGIAPLELVGGEPGCTEFILADLARHGVTLRETVDEPA
jgi:saccharopine dehydrogenase-like NADP-dependent oxidoreductase